MSNTEQNNPNDAVEVDKRFPSGEWNGFWIRRYMHSRQRGWMELHLSFSDGVLHGEGRDLNGGFTIRGRYDSKSGEVTFTMSHGHRDIFYKGWAQRDKGIWGVWEMPSVRDGFHIWPKGMTDPTRSSLDVHADQTVEEEKPVLDGGVDSA